MHHNEGDISLSIPYIVAMVAFAKNFMHAVCFWNDNACNSLIKGLNFHRYNEANLE